MIEHLITRTKDILLKSGLSYIVAHFDDLESVNLLGESVQEIMDMPLALLEKFSYQENFFAITTRENRIRISSFAQKFPVLFAGPVSYGRARFLHEILCQRVVELTDKECALGLEFLANKFEREHYEYYLFYLQMREYLRGVCDLDIRIQIVEGWENFKTTYDIAEEKISKLYHDSRVKKYERLKEISD